MSLQHRIIARMGEAEKKLRDDMTPPAMKELLDSITKKRGPKPSGNAKQLLTLRLDPDVIEKFKATGPGWQARMNEALKAAKV